MNMIRKNGGFTLVELIVVIAILAILAGVAVPAYSGYIEKAQDAAVITELDAIQTAAQAANATAGEIEKIEVRTSGETTIVKVFFEAGATSGTYNRAPKFGDDFELYYAGTAGSVDETDGSVSITVGKKVLNGSYAEGANWENGRWTENCVHVYKTTNGNHSCTKCDAEGSCIDLEGTTTTEGTETSDGKCDVCGGEVSSSNG